MKLSIASLGAEPTARFLDQVRLAEFLGFHAFFHNDKKWAQDVYVRLGAATQVTSRIGLGISATDPYTRHPALTAQAGASLAEMASAHISAAPNTLPLPIPVVTPEIKLTRKVFPNVRAFVAMVTLHLFSVIRCSAESLISGSDTCTP